MTQQELSRFQNSCSAPLGRFLIAITLGCVSLPIVFQVLSAKLIHVAKGESSRFSCKTFGLSNTSCFL